ncbi:hypothetical protein OHB42_38210 [Streptomyces sp. NBC_00134]|nr:hypothetical protein [Streptomyces sp. NBC_01361]
MDRVVHNNVDLLAGMRLRCLLQEGQEVRPVPARLALAGHLAGMDIQGGEQIGGAVPHVVVGALLARAEGDRQHRLGPVQRLYLRLLIDGQHHRAAGRGQVQADDIGDLVRECAVLRNLEGAVPVRLEILLSVVP